MHTGSVFFFHNHKHPLHCIADLFLSKGLMSLFVFSYYSCKKTCIFWDLNLTLAGAQCTGSCLWSAQGQVEWRFWAWGIWSSHAASIFPCPAYSLQTATPHFSRPSAWTTLKWLQEIKFGIQEILTCELLCCLLKTDQIAVLSPKKGILYTAVWMCVELFDKELVMFTSLRKR